MFVQGLITWRFFSFGSYVWSFCEQWRHKHVHQNPCK
jgi:hypothetical protein